MATAIAQAESRAIVFNRDGDVFTNSRTVAENFEKTHRNVLQAIDNLLATEPTLALRNFQHGSYKLQATGEQLHRSFDMDRRGFALLAMGFTGATALRWKLQFMDAFELMERELQARPAAIDPNDPAQLRALLIDYSEKTLALQSKVETLEVPQARHLADTGAIPTFKLPGNRNTCARRSTLKAWLEKLEVEGRR